MTDHGLRRLHLVQRLLWTQTHYPWSVLWILFAVGVGMLAGGLVIPTLIVFFLVVVVATHSLRMAREAKTESRKD